MTLKLAEKTKGGQWRVASEGLECEGYLIEKARLNARRDGLYEWPQQVCTKEWVDFDDFIAAFEAAVEFHHRGYDDSVMQATVAKCRRRIAESEEFDAVCREMFPERFTGGIHGFFPSEFDDVNKEILRRRALKAA